MEAVKKIELNPGIKSITSTKEKVRNTYTEELIFGFCAPIGTERHLPIEELKNILQQTYNYEVEIIKLSKFIEERYNPANSTKAGETAPFTSLMNKIEGGDFLRNKHGSACLAELAIQEIYVSRLIHADASAEDVLKPENLKTRRKCFIIDSFKNTEEVNLFREVYTDLFYCFSIFSSENIREKNLLSKGLSIDEIKLIMETDEFEDNHSGQNVRDTFVEGDFFIRISEETKRNLSLKLNRYLNVIFECDIVTPLPNEIAMYEAKSAAGNSACLSRQVGAAITNDKGEIISRGWNDVPKFGGNLYKEGNPIDHRCRNLGYCSNDTTKDTLTDNILSQIFENEELVQEMFGGKVPNRTIQEKLSTIIRKSTKIKDLIEFSRSVHAEMHAIILGSQLAGNQMIGGKLFCTTYPCHNCARHIIVAGIKEIYYIEPYTKSLCIELHKDAITEDETVNDKVKLLVYDGIAPRRFLEFFTMNVARKDKEGHLYKKDKTLVLPKSRITLQALPTLEQQAIHSLSETGLK